MTECLQELEGQLQVLEATWALRWERCKESWGLQMLQQRLDQAEAWLASREGLLLDPNCGVSHGPALLAAVVKDSSRCSFSHWPLRPGCRPWVEALSIPSSWASYWLVSPQNSVSDVELLLLRHQDLEKLLAAQEEKFVQLQRKVGVNKAGQGSRRRWGLNAGGGCRPRLSLSVTFPLGPFPSGKLHSSPCQLQCVVIPTS